MCIPQGQEVFPFWAISSGGTTFCVESTVAKTGVRKDTLPQRPNE